MMEREKIFSKAIKTETEILREELLWESVEGFLNYIWTEGILQEMKVEKWDFEKFQETVLKELKMKKWEIKDFRHQKSNEPITNVFKKCLKIIAKEEGVDLTNDIQSRILNLVRKQYSVNGELSAGLFPPVAFRERSEWGIPEDLGDLNSCFRSGGCNEGNTDWLIEEYETFGRAFLVVFHYHQGERKGIGRCWAFKVNNSAIYATNIYSKGVDLKHEGFKFTIVRLLRKLFDLSENVKFAMRIAPLPIYLNGDGIVIYEPSQWESSAHVLDAIGQLKSKCLWCLEEVEIYELRKYDEPIYYSTVGERVNGLIVCRNCSYQLDGMDYCHDCGEIIHPSDAHYIEGVGYICDRCFGENWFYCDECDEPHHRDYSIVTPDGWCLCEYCASKFGAICEICGQYYYFDDEEVNIQEYTINRGHLSGVHICSRCAEKYLYSYQCHQCGRELHYIAIDYRISVRLRDMVRLEECLDCYCKRMRDAFDEAFGNREHPSLFTHSIDPGERVLREILSME